MGGPTGHGPYADDVEDEVDHLPDSSAEYAAELGRWCRRALESSGHTGCQWLSGARYVPESAAVICGCGEFVPAPMVEEPRGDEPDAGERDAVLAENAKAFDRIAGSMPYQAADPINSTLALIDPTEIYTPDLVERHILDVLARLETGALFERECIVRFDKAATEWNRVYFATIHTSAQTSELKRKAEAEVECHEAGLTAERDEAKMLVSAAKATMHNLRAVLSGYQSVAKSVTAAYNPGGSAGRF
jgi:hypothetical protein